MKNILYILAALLLVACKKQQLPELPENNSPIFSIQGTIDGDSISISAGDDDYYMHSSESEFHRVKQWKGSLANNTSKFELILSDGIIDVPNSTFDIADLEYLPLTSMPDQPLLELTKNDLTNAEFIDNIIWTVDGVPHANPSHLMIYEPGKYSICAEVTFIDQTQAMSCNEVILGYDKNAKGELKFIVGQNNTLLAFFDTPEYEIDFVEWYSNDSLISNNKVNLNMEMNTNTCNLKAIVHYANGVVRERSVFVDKLNTANYIQDLTTFENQSSISWDFKLRMNIEYNGQHYSALESTTNDTHFEVQSISEYGYNASGDQVLLVRGKLSAPFFHEESESVVNSSFNLSFALPYK